MACPSTVAERATRQSAPDFRPQAAWARTAKDTRFHAVCKRHIPTQDKIATHHPLLQPARPRTRHCTPSWLHLAGTQIQRWCMVQGSAWFSREAYRGVEVLGRAGVEVLVHVVALVGTLVWFTRTRKDELAVVPLRSPHCTRNTARKIDSPTSLHRSHKPQRTATTWVTLFQATKAARSQGALTQTNKQWTGGSLWKKDGMSLAHDDLKPPDASLKGAGVPFGP